MAATSIALIRRGYRYADAQAAHPSGRSAEAERLHAMEGLIQKGIDIGANWKFYQDAWPSRSRNYWPQQLYDAKDQIDSWSRERIMAESRRLRANLPFMTQSVGCLSTFAVGNAFAPQFRTGDTEWDEATGEFIQRWYDICDIRGILDLAQGLCLASESIDVDGDFGVYLTEHPGSHYPALQFIHAHRIKTDPERPERAIQGVVMNSAGRHLAYHVRQDDDSVIEIPARDFILVGDPERFDQVRYMGAFANCVGLMEDMKELGIAEMIGAKQQTNSNIIEYNELGLPEVPLGNFFNDTTGQTKIAVPGSPTGQTFNLPTELSMPGERRYSKIGNKIELVESKRPSPAWHGLMEWLERQGCHAEKMPYEFVINPEKLGGTSARAIVEKAYRTIGRRQDLLKKLAKRIVIWRTAKAIKNKEIPPNPFFWRLGFQMPKKLTVDKGRDEAARQSSYMCGTRTLDGYLAEENEDWVQHRQQKLIEAMDKCEKADVIFQKYKGRPGFTFAMAVELMEKWESGATVKGAGPVPGPAGSTSGGGGSGGGGGDGGEGSGS